MYNGSETVEISLILTSLEENVLTMELYALTECHAFLLEQLHYVQNA